MRAGWAAAVILAAALLVACGDSKRSPADVAEVTESPAVTATAAPTTTATAAPGGCPVDAEICAFARETQAALAEGDFWSLLAGTLPTPTRDPEAIVESIRVQLWHGTGGPRLTGVACPVFEGKPSCAERFALAFTSFAEGEPADPAGPGRVLVGFERRPARPILVGLAVAPPAAAMADGGPVPACGLEGKDAGGCVILRYAATVPPDDSLGLVARPLHRGPDVPLPVGVSIVAATCANKGHGGCWELVRYTGTRAGMVKRVLLTTELGNGGWITDVRASAGGRVLFASVCHGSECPYEGGPKAVTTEFLRSTDSGNTWSSVGSASGEWWVRGVIGDEAAAVDFSGFEYRFQLEPSGQPLVRPGAAAQDRVPFDLGGGPGWAAANRPELLDATGQTVLSLPLRPAAGREAVIEGFTHPEGSPPLALVKLRLAGNA